MGYGIRKIEWSPEPWWNGEKFTAERGALAVYETEEEANEFLEFAKKHSYIPVEVFPIL